MRRAEHALLTTPAEPSPGVLRARDLARLGSGDRTGAKPAVTPNGCGLELWRADAVVLLGLACALRLIYGLAQTGLAEPEENVSVAFSALSLRLAQEIRGNELTPILPGSGQLCDGTLLAILPRAGTRKVAAHLAPWIG